MTETFGKKLRDLRVKSDIGLRELARLINKSPGYLSDVEHDHVPPPSEDVILKIADAIQPVSIGKMNMPNIWKNDFDVFAKVFFLGITI